MLNARLLDISGNFHLKISPGSCIRVHVALTYGGRQMSLVCPPNAGPKDTKKYLGYEPTIPANRDFYFSQKADPNGRIDKWVRFQGNVYASLNSRFNF